MRYDPRLLLVSALIFLALPGCGGSDPATRAKQSHTTATLLPDQILEKVVAAYQGCKAYSDRGEVRLFDGVNAQPTKAKFSVEYKRPGFLHAQVYQLEVASDGQHLRARITDEDSNNFDQQTVLRPLDKKIELADLYTDRELYEAMTRGRAGHPVQLNLLLGKDPLKLFRSDGAQLKVVEPQKLGAHRCFRILSQTASGKFILWVDQEEYLLRRIEYPPIKDGDRRMSLIVEFLGARFQVDEPATYSFPDRPNDRQVRFFVKPPQPLPSQLFGKTVSPFSFTGMDGKPVRLADVRGKTVVLVWFNDHVVCQQMLQQLDKVRQRFAQQKKVKFLAVAILPATQTNDSITALLKGWGTDFTIVRDLQAHGKSVFGVTLAPTLVVLDRVGRLQIFEEGMNPRLDQELPQVVTKVASGVDMSALVLRRHRFERNKYLESLRVAEKLAGKTGGAQTAADIPKTQAVEKRLPAQIVLQQKWESRELASPGNVIHLPQRKQFLLVEGKRQAVLIDERGQVVKRASLGDADVTLIRSWRNKAGKLFFVATAIRGKQVVVMDDQLQVLYRYPPTSQRHAGIGDAVLADLDGNDKPELYVGFWDVVGVHQVIDGKRQRSNRLPSNVVSLAVSPANPVGWHKLLVTTNSGRLWRINQYLREDPAIEIPNWAVFRLAGNQRESSGAPYLGLAYDAQDRLNAVAVGRTFKEVWHYPLPTGVFANHIRLAHFGQLVGRDVWLVVAPDSSVHLVSPDGSFSDNFAFGEHLMGICIGGGSELVLVTKGRITAYSVSQKSQVGKKKQGGS